MNKEFNSRQEYLDYLKKLVFETGNVKEFAEKNGIERTTIYSFLSGRNSANPTEKKILEALGLSKQEDKKVKIILKKK